MKRLPSSYDVSIKAFRALTAAETDGAVTRARLLERATRPRHRTLRRHLALAVLGTVSISLSSAAAWIGFPLPWQAPRAQHVDTAEDLVVEGLEGHARRSLRTIPAAVGEDATPVAAADAGREANVYGTAHWLHFVADAPAQAITAWDTYLRAFLHGLFVPEARYNRALCLIRLGRRAEAERALHVFTRAGGDGYRRAEAERLLDWIRSRPVTDEKH